MTRRQPYYYGRDRRSPEERERDAYFTMVIATAPRMPYPLPGEVVGMTSIREVLAIIERLRPGVEEARKAHFARAREEAPVAVKGWWVAMNARKVEEEARERNLNCTHTQPARPRKPPAPPRTPSTSTCALCAAAFPQPNRGPGKLYCSPRCAKRAEHQRARARRKEQCPNANPSTSP
jgi:hypothetical protein